jgi:hypothetical protein
MDHGRMDQAASGRCMAREMGFARRVENCLGCDIPPPACPIAPVPDQYRISIGDREWTH